MALLKRPSAVTILFLMLATLLLCVVWMRSHRTFDYWTSPDLLKKNHRLSVGSAWGQIMIAYGYPSRTTPVWALISEPVFGNEPNLEAHELALPEERVDLAHQQFGIHIDGVAVPVAYPFLTIPVGLIVFPFVGSVLILTIHSRRRLLKSRDEQAGDLSPITPRVD